MTTLASASITAKNTFATTARLERCFNLSISGQWVAAVTTITC